MVLDKFRDVQLTENEKNKLNSKTKKQNSNKPPSNLLSISQYQKQKIDAQNLTNQELVRCCVAHSESNIYWKEFYTRFNDLIDKCILKTLGRLEITRDKVTLEISDEISFMLMEKLHGKRILVRALKHPNMQAWLTTVVRNVVWSWNRKRSLRRNIVNTWVEKKKKSIDEPIGEDGDSVTLGDMIQGPDYNLLFNDHFQRIQYHVKTVLNDVEKLPQIQKLVFKISLMFYNSLDAPDIQEIADMRAVTPSKIIKEVNGLMNSLVMNNEEHEHQQDLLFIKFSVIENLRRRYYKMAKKLNTPTEQLKEIAEEIKEKEKDLQNERLRAGKMYVYPEAKEIAQLLGIPSTNIGVWLFRAKESLQKIKLQ